jgi:hypothetical protein
MNLQLNTHSSNLLAATRLNLFPSRDTATASSFKCCRMRKLTPPSQTPVSQRQRAATLEPQSHACRLSKMNSTNVHFNHLNYECCCGCAPRTFKTRRDIAATSCHAHSTTPSRAAVCSARDRLHAADEQPGSILQLPFARESLGTSLWREL